MKEEIKFAKWCMEHIVYLSDCTYAHGNFEFPEVKKTYFDTIDEIYDYWKKNVEPGRNSTKNE